MIPPALPPDRATTPSLYRRAQASLATPPPLSPPSTPARATTPSSTTVASPPPLLLIVRRSHRLDVRRHRPASRPWASQAAPATTALVIAARYRLRHRRSEE